MHRSAVVQFIASATNLETGISIVAILGKRSLAPHWLVPAMTRVVNHPKLCRTDLDFTKQFSSSNLSVLGQLCLSDCSLVGQKAACTGCFRNVSRSRLKIFFNLMSQMINRNVRLEAHHPKIL